MQNPGKALIVMGAILLICGLLLVAFPRLALGRLPGDLSFRKGGVQIYIPLATSLLLSAVLSFLFWILRR